jgi:hypothetical protein
MRWLELDCCPTPCPLQAEKAIETMEESFRKELAAEKRTVARELQQAGWLQSLFGR